MKFVTCANSFARPNQFSAAIITAVAAPRPITTTANGIIYYVGGEIATTDFTRTSSDQVIHSIATGNTSITGTAQFKTNSASPNTLTNGMGNSWRWDVAYAAYATQ